MDNDSLIAWIEAVIEAYGRGGHTFVATSLGITTTHLSKILKRKSGFDEKTLRLMAWIISSKSQDYSGPVQSVTTKGPLVIETRVDGEEKIITWKTK